MYSPVRSGSTSPLPTKSNESTNPSASRVTQEQMDLFVAAQKEQLVTSIAQKIEQFKSHLSRSELRSDPCEDSSLGDLLLSRVNICWKSNISKHNKITSHNHLKICNNMQSSNLKKLPDHLITLF